MKIRLSSLVHIPFNIIPPILSELVCVFDNIHIYLKMLIGKLKKY